MKKSLRILVALSVVASTISSLQPASASYVIGALYNGTSGDVACTTGGVDTGFFTILNNVVIRNSNYTCAGNAVIPVGVTSVEGWAFQERELTSISIPSTVLSIGSYAFSFQFLITSLTIPDSVASLGDSAFAGLNQISSYEYCGTSLTNVNLSFAGLGSKTKVCPPRITSPGSPTSVVASTGKRSAKVSFGSPASNGGSAVTSYTATSTPGGFTKTLTQSAGGTFFFDGLEPSTFYSFAVTATNAIGTSAATSSNLVKTLALDFASMSALSFQDDGTGTAGKIVWAGMNIDAVLYTGDPAFYPGPFNYGAFTSGWNGQIRNLTPSTSYTVSINAISSDGVGVSKSLTFKTNAAPPVQSGYMLDSITRAEQNSDNLLNIFKWIDENIYNTWEVGSLKTVLNKFDTLDASNSSAYLQMPYSRVLTISAYSFTPEVCLAGGIGNVITSRKVGTCTIAFTVLGPSRAPVTLIKDMVFNKFTNW